VNGQTAFYDNGQVFGDFVQVRKVNGDGYECKRKKCVAGVIIPWPTTGCPPVARTLSTTTATVVVTGPSTATPTTASNDFVNKISGDPADPTRVTVISTVQISAPTAVVTCKLNDATKPEGFQYRIQSGDVDHHCSIGFAVVEYGSVFLLPWVLPVQLPRMSHRFQTILKGIPSYCKIPQPPFKSLLVLPSKKT